jgi:AcrR family transcriptional regulator
MAADQDRMFDGGALSLVYAAERLFAERGVAAVSIRQIVNAAGHKNMSAAHYHFGSRDGLVRAVLQLRMPYVDRRRRELMNRQPQTSADRQLRFYVEVFVVPLSELLIPRSEGNYYLRFLEQYRFIPHADLLGELAPATFEMGDHIKSLLQDLPGLIVEARLRNAWSMIVAALASIEQRVGDGRIDKDMIGLLTADIIDEMAAALSAPLSARTLQIFHSTRSAQFGAMG